MEYQDFVTKWFTHTEQEKIDKILEVLDIFYLEFKPSQVMELVGQYLDNADDIFNTKNTSQNEKDNI